MTSYGGYTTTYGGDTGGGGGGFVGGSQSGSQGQGGGRNYNEDSLRPVTIKQLLDTEEAYPGASEFTIDGAVATQLTLVGQVRAINPQPTNVTYRIDDGTGVIDVKKWVDADKNEDASDGGFALDQYVRVFGRLKLFNQKRYVGAHFIRAIEDYNEVSYHLLECTYVHLSLTRGSPHNANGGPATNGAAAHGDSMFVDQDHGSGGGGGGYTNGAVGGSNFTPNAQKVFNFLRNTALGNEGVHVDAINSELKLGYKPTIAAIQELTDNSVIYATVDDETFALM